MLWTVKGTGFAADSSRMEIDAEAVSRALLAEAEFGVRAVQDLDGTTMFLLELNGEDMYGWIHEEALVLLVHLPSLPSVGDRNAVLRALVEDTPVLSFPRAHLRVHSDDSMTAVTVVELRFDTHADMQVFAEQLLDYGRWVRTTLDDLGSSSARPSRQPPGGKSRLVGV
jgi:hypothetical protein